MAAPRQIVSYDDLFDDETGASENIGEPQQHPGDSNNGMGTGDSSDDEINDDGTMESAVGNPEAWDDSDLIHAWDSTIKDYREFHEGIMNDEEYMSGAHKLESRIGAWSLTTGDSPTRSSRKRRRASGTEVETELDNRQPPGIAEWAAHLDAPQSEEDALHQLNMAWYYVGYYSACYQAFRTDIRNNSTNALPETAESVAEDPSHEPGAQDPLDEHK
ncbi:hypothetical protein COEREDRAFT_87033 [Coemansia reversa NRRL 1564]|uniref:Survival Motor Neuron Gemin2-binding domain-containing protein n=1 Tax=Coemansia reversa (strain ATCC 12441 / NRRL 1564) TaxID=763665 RepID=A0A2G5BBD5_COERN|nr:hypothetical protein COEREDRAFT_87033 [Coemansia reversa NRRL 1564]|eukprot:PIA16321.1 hypothetical protein COEREDRAFT_87033 [Coemansia reversa NRRL 1564]